MAENSFDFVLPENLLTFQSFHILVLLRVSRYIEEDPPLLVAEHDDAADERDGGDGEEVGIGDHLAQVGRPVTQLLWCTAKKKCQ